MDGGQIPATASKYEMKTRLPTARVSGQTSPTKASLNFKDFKFYPNCKSTLKTKIHKETSSISKFEVGTFDIQKFIDTLKPHLKEITNEYC